MAFKATEPFIVNQAIADTSTTQNWPLGTVIRAVDPTYGAGEFIYLKGVASTVVGSIVEYNSTFQTGLSTTATAGLDAPHPLAISMSANIANQYGWYQISGQAIAVKSSAQSLVADTGIEASAGFAVALATGAIINGAIVAVVASAKSGGTSVQLCINRPHDPSDVS